MRKVFLAIWIATTPAIASDVGVTCTADSKMYFHGASTEEMKPGGPYNFTITRGAIQTPYGGDCARMTGTINAHDIIVRCGGKLLQIDRKLGTFSELDDGLDGASELTSGTCQKREGF